MFGMTGTELPYRSRKDLVRAQQMRGLTRRRGGPATLLMENMWMPTLKQDYWRHGFSDGGMMLPTLSNRFEELSDRQQPPSSMSMSDDRYGSRYAKDSKRRSDSTREPVPFDQAADALSQALQFAMKHCKSIRGDFEKEIERSTISLWAPRAAVDALWGVKLEWNGIDLALLEKNANQQASPEVVTYKGLATRLSTALEDVKNAGPPRGDYAEESGSKLRPEVFRVTLKKLHVTMQGVEELMQSVRADRTLMGPLVKDMKAVTVLLGEMEDLWRPRERERPSVGKTRARWEDEECSWPDHQSEGG